MYSKEISYLLGGILGFTLVSPMQAQATQDPLKVAFIEDDGFYTMEVNGGYSGYNYDYLMKVAQFTDWNYEFVVIEEEKHRSAIEVAEDLLAKGEIDLLGSSFYSQEIAEHFEVGENNYSVARHILCGLTSNAVVTMDTFFLQESISVAIVRDNIPSYQAFLRIMDDVQIESKITYVEDEEEALALVLSGEVDSLMTLDLSYNASMLSTFTSLSPTPLYFISTKGNVDLIKELDKAIEEIHFTNYPIQGAMREEYFGTINSGEIVKSQEVENALAEYPYLTIGLLKGREPYQFYNGEEDVPKGISVQILEEISKIIGVDFRYVWLDDREAMRDSIANQKIDLCSTVPYDSNYDLTYFFDVVLTQPYLTNAVAWLHQGNNRETATPLYYYLADNIPFYPDEELTEIFDIEATLKAFSDYGNISLFADPFMAQYQIQKHGITNIDMQTISSMESKICFGVGKHLDSSVVGLLNHAILHLDPFIVDEIIYNNVTVQHEVTFEAYLKQNYATVLTWCTALLIFIILGLTHNAKKFRRLAQEDSLTKLYNAGYFHDYCEKYTKKTEQGCLILLDIDFFKQVNDTHGDHAGDKVIQAVAEALKRNFNGNDKVARLGGDEFVILIEGDCTIENLEERGRTILQELINSGNHVPVSLSIGGYIFDKGTSYEELYRLADSVLYKVKENGRNGYLFSND